MGNHRWDPKVRIFILHNRNFLVLVVLKSIHVWQQSSKGRVLIRWPDSLKLCPRYPQLRSLSFLSISLLRLFISLYISLNICRSFLSSLLFLCCRRNVINFYYIHHNYNYYNKYNYINSIIVITYRI